MVRTPRGVGRVLEVNVIKQEAVVLLNESQVHLTVAADLLAPERAGRHAGCAGGCGPADPPGGPCDESPSGELDPNAAQRDDI
jgi:hypothetical protein